MSMDASEKKELSDKVDGLLDIQIMKQNGPSVML